MSFKVLDNVPLSSIGDKLASQGVEKSLLPAPCCLWTTMLWELSNLQVPAVCRMEVFQGRPLHSDSALSI